MKKVLLVGLNSYDNLGDRILMDTCEYLVKKSDRDNDIEIEKLDLMKNTQSLSQSHQISTIARFLSYFFTIVVEILLKVIPDNSRVIFALLSLKNKIKYSYYFKNKINKSECVIFVGGAYLKYKGEEFQYSIRHVLKLSKKYDVPVMLNAIGIEGYDNKDIRCLSHKKCINFDNVKIITTRDEKKFLLDNFIVNKKIVVDEVGDPALWIDECFEISKNSEYDVGINVAYLALFDSYGVESNMEYQDIIKQLIIKLQEKNISFALFCNGKMEDFQGVKEIKECLDVPILEKPCSSREYIEQVSKFKIVVPTRLHAMITAYALGIDCTGFVWNHKVDAFLNRTRLIDHFQNVKIVDIDKIVDSIENLLIENNKSKVELNSLKQKTYYYIDSFIKEFL